MTTHAQETKGPNGTGTHGITPDGAPQGTPQAGGFSGVAAAPGEGARAREATMEPPSALDAAYTERNRLVAALARIGLSLGWRVGLARTEIEGWSPEWHGCVYLDSPEGQLSWHFHERERALFDGLPDYAGEWDGHTTPEKYERVARICTAPAPSSPRAEAPEAAGNNPGLISTPVGGALRPNARGEQQLRRDGASVISAPEAEPADAAVQRVSDEDVARAVCAWNQWPTEGGMFRLTLINAQHHDVLVEGMRRALATDRAALRRAAPGAAPEQRDVSVALGKMDEVLRNTTDRVTPVMFLREQLEAVVAFLRATPAPTGERAGGEGEPWRCVVPDCDFATASEHDAYAHTSGDHACLHQRTGKRAGDRDPAPVAAPRESVGCALCGRPRFQHFGRREHCFPEMLEGGKCWTPAPRGTEGRDDA